MSENNTEKAEVAPRARSFEKMTMILVAVAVVLSLVNTVLLLLNPTVKKVEAANEELKSSVAESINAMHKKIDGLRTAEAEWQSVLKKAKEKPGAVYKIENTQDGYLTLTEVASAEK